MNVQQVKNRFLHTPAFIRSITHLGWGTFICASSAFICVCAWAKPEPATVETAFTPGEDVAALIVEHIRKARSRVQMQAYLFTDRRIANALLAARKRGVEVEVI